MLASLRMAEMPEVHDPNDLPAPTREFYRRALTELDRAGIPHLVGGAYAMSVYTGLRRHTKDLDVFIRPADMTRACAVLGARGCTTEPDLAHWLGKAFCGEDFVDLISGLGNGAGVVDDTWFAHAVPGSLLGLPVRLCPAEETLWAKAFIMERERYDGADVLHLIHDRGAVLDWPRLVARFGEHWRVLLSHLVLFGFVYPAQRAAVPRWVLDELIERLVREHDGPPGPPWLCRGTLLSGEQYRLDLERGYIDARPERARPPRPPS